MPSGKTEAVAPEPLRVEREGDDALRIEGDGVRVILRAKPLQSRRGWGVKITGEATSIDGLEHRFELIGRKPFHWAGSIHYGGTPESSPFQMGGVYGVPPSELVVGPSSVATFGEDFPGTSNTLWITRGQSLSLVVSFNEVRTGGSGHTWGKVGTIGLWVPKAGAPTMQLTP
jgi:hypothetical protein